jgi:hypothetical protein
VVIAAFEQIPMKKSTMYMYGQKIFNFLKVPFSVQVPTCDMKSAWIPENLIRVWSITKLPISKTS